MAKKTARKKQNIPKDESKAARFVRVVMPRVGKAVKAINQIGLCSASNYEYTPEQLKQISKAISEAYDNMLAKFAGKKSEGGEFTFKE